MTTEIGTVAPVTAAMMLPELLQTYPQLRVILDRYGLRGCGGPYGPAESLGYFSKAHGVDAEQLVRELNEALRDPSLLPPETSDTTSNDLDELADTIYRRFFKAGIVVAMTAGAVWGAILLLRIGFAGSFTAIPIHEINAHGHAQIFGWVGLFVMGFAYQAFPRLKHTNLWRPDLANLSFYLMVFGVFARALGEPLFVRPLFRELALIANMAEVAAIALFLLIIVTTFRRSGKRYERHDAFIVASLLFFLIQVVYELALLYQTTAGVSRDALLHLVSVYQSPLRDLQIHGFAMLMILGVGLRMFPALFGFSPPKPTMVRVSFMLLVGAIVGEVVFFILMRTEPGAWTAGGWWACVAVLAITSLALTFRWGLLASPTESDRSIKFIQTGVGWLHVSMLMLVLAPLYTQFILPSAVSLSPSGQRSLAIGFSHAYAGAVRHAITVGFISLIILGMGAKIVPTLGGVDVRRLKPLWGVFLLVNVGCLMRVAFQIATDFYEWAYPVAGVSGLLEITGIAAWGIHLWRIMNGRASSAIAPARPSRITADDRIGWIVQWFPQTLPLFLSKGFTPLANPILRKTLARTISLRQAAAHHHLDLDSLLAELNQAALGEPADSAAPHEGTTTTSLPVLN